MYKHLKPQTRFTQNGSISGWACCLIFAVCVILGAFIFPRFATAGNVQESINFLTKVCHNVPCFIGLGMLAVVWLLYRWLSGNASLLDLFRGKDNKYSVSKCQFLLWTVLVFFSYTSLFAARIGRHLVQVFDPAKIGSDLANLPSNLLLAMGLSVTTVLAAKGIVQNQISSGAVTREPVGENEAGMGDLLKDDDGAIDLSKVQMMGWTVIGLAAYLISVLRMIHQIDVGQMTDARMALPDIDQSLMVLMGLGHGTYLVKKMITAATPVITGIKGCTAGAARLGSEVEISGTGFGNAKADSVITCNGMNASFPITGWTATSIKFTLSDPALQMTAGKVKLRVVVSNQQSETVELTLLPEKPAITAVTVAAPPAAGRPGTVTVTGSGFGPGQGAATGNNQGQIVINGPAAAQVTSKVLTWTDASITLENTTGPAALKAGDNVHVIFTYNAGDKVDEALTVT